MARLAISAALALTFDNLGEASSLARGETVPSVGEHPSVTEALPRLLDELDACGLRATFFVEGINCELYPDAVREIAARGHELGMHGWLHERWVALSDVVEREVIDRAMAAFASLDLAPRGFRPPGGMLNQGSSALLRAAGIEWCSPEGDEFGVRDGLAYVPFDWELVDAYHLMGAFSQLRASRGDGAAPLDAGAALSRLRAGVEAAARDARPTTVIMHPFLMLDPAWWGGVRSLLARIARLARDGGLSVGPGGALARESRAL
ncbi:MAG TPA: polysaccharide deacetylase family protein [Solirubrobacteraceae bacterium]